MSRKREENHNLDKNCSDSLFFLHFLFNPWQQKQCSTWAEKFAARESFASVVSLSCPTLLSLPDRFVTATVTAMMDLISNRQCCLSYSQFSDSPSIIPFPREMNNQFSRGYFCDFSWLDIIGSKIIIEIFIKPKKWAWWWTNNLF